MAGIVPGTARNFPGRSTIVTPDECPAKNPLGALMSCAHRGEHDGSDHTCPYLLSVRLAGNITVSQSVGELAVRMLNADRASLNVVAVCSLGRRSGRASSW